MKLIPKYQSASGDQLYPLGTPNFGFLGTSTFGSLENPEQRRARERAAAASAARKKAEDEARRKADLQTRHTNLTTSRSGQTQQSDATRVQSVTPQKDAFIDQVNKTDRQQKQAIASSPWGKAHPNDIESAVRAQINGLQNQGEIRQGKLTQEDLNKQLWNETKQNILSPIYQWSKPYLMPIMKPIVEFENTNIKIPSLYSPHSNAYITQPARTTKLPITYGDAANGAAVIGNGLQLSGVPHLEAIGTGLQVPATVFDTANLYTEPTLDNTFDFVSNFPLSNVAKSSKTTQLVDDAWSTTQQINDGLNLGHTNLTEQIRNTHETSKYH